MREQLSQGKSGEDRVYKILKEFEFNPIFVEKAERSYFDIKCNNFTIEIKNDIKALESGNVAFEVYNPFAQRISGLSITKADFWVHIVGEEIWITSVKRLSTFIGLVQPYKIIEAAGDKNATIYLYKKDYVIPCIFIRMDILNREELYSLTYYLLNEKDFN